MLTIRIKRAKDLAESIFTSGEVVHIVVYVPSCCDPKNPWYFYVEEAMMLDLRGGDDAGFTRLKAI
jgi:hypothetical protein